MPKKFTARNVSRFIDKKFEQFVDKEFRRIEKEVQEFVGDQVELALAPENSPEVNSMVNSRATGELKAQLGLTAPQRKVNGIIKHLQDQIKVVKQRRKGRRRLQLSLPVNYGTLLSKGFALQENTSRNATGPLPWLLWMTQLGDRIISRTHRAVRVPGTRASRSGTSTIMIKGSNNNLSSFWRVPSRYSGTVNDNFITRALDKRGPAIEKGTKRILDLAVRRATRRSGRIK